MNRGQAVPGATITAHADGHPLHQPAARALSSSTWNSPASPGLQNTNLVLNASDRLSVGDLVLKVGGVSETVVVESERAPIQTESSEMAR